MVSIVDTDHPSLEQDDIRAPLGGSGLPEEILHPVIAGAYARGIADAFQLLDVPALFLDREGRVLSANDRAKPALSRGLQLRSGHLLTRARKDNHALAEFMADALRDPGQRPAVTLATSRLTLRALPVPSRAAGTTQLLHAIVLIDESDGQE